MVAQPTSVKEYLAALPADRREALEAVRATIAKHLDPKFEEGIQYGMIGYYLPLSAYPAGYHCDPRQPLPFASLASQKNHMAIYLFCIYTTPGEPERFAQEWRATGKRLDMGKSCVRFKSIEDVPLDVVARAIKRATAKKFVAAYEESLAASATGQRALKKASKKVSAKKAASKKKATKKKVAKKKTAKKKAAKQPVAKKHSTKKKATKKKTAAKKTTPKRTTKKKSAKKAVAKRASGKQARKKAASK